MATYKQAGVDIAAGTRFVEMIKQRVAAAWTETAQEIGGFAGGGPIPQGYARVVASTDGTGTKAIIAAMVERFDGIGQDAVAMAAVDAYVAGSQPAYLLDNLDVARLNSELHIRIIESIIRGCQLADCRLIGGETAEHPDMFKQPWMFDLSATAIGFSVPELVCVPVEPGQLVFGWPSYGVCSNGFSLVRRVFKLDRGVRKARRVLEHSSLELGFKTLAEVLLKPTPIWIKEVDWQRIKGVKFAGHAHITGGGMVDNIPRILPIDCKVVIDRQTWPRPAIFRMIQEAGKVSLEEMDQTFNQGIILVSIVSPDGNPVTQRDAYCIGQVEKRRGDEPQVQLEGNYND